MKTPRQIKIMNEAGSWAAELLDTLQDQIKPGVTTHYLDFFIKDWTEKRNLICAPYQYIIDKKIPPFPGHACFSKNEVVCHGIPDSIPLVEGDIINVDVTLIYKKHHADTSRTFAVGNISKEKAALLEITKKCLNIGIEQMFPGNPISNIGNAIEDFLLDTPYLVYPQICGHGIGKKFHENPTIPFSRNRNNSLLKEGMVITCEPAITQESIEINLLDDLWTVVNENGNISSQEEHTVAITKNGPQILTLR